MEKDLVKVHGLKSIVWEHYGFKKNDTGVVDKTMAICRHCFEGLKYTGSTTNLMNHIKRHHKGVDLGSKVPSNTQTPSVCESTSSTSSSSQPSPSMPRMFGLFAQKLSDKAPRAKSITDTISAFIVQDMRPYSIVETNAFKQMITTCEPRYKVPSRTFFSETAIPKLYNDQKIIVQNELSQAIRVATTTDGWTSRATESYITITSHHISPDWQLKNFVLQTRPIYEGHTGVNVGKILKDAAAEWGYNDKNPSVTVDNAANMDVAGKYKCSAF